TILPVERLCKTGVLDEERVDRRAQLIERLVSVRGRILAVQSRANHQRADRKERDIGYGEVRRIVVANQADSVAGGPVKHDGRNVFGHLACSLISELREHLLADLRDPEMSG